MIKFSQVIAPDSVCGRGGILGYLLFIPVWYLSGEFVACLSPILTAPLLDRSLLFWERRYGCWGCPDSQGANHCRGR